MDTDENFKMLKNQMVRFALDKTRAQVKRKSIFKINQTFAMRSFLKWIVVVVNLFAIFVMLGLRSYAIGRHNVDVEDAYQGLISRGLLDESKAEAYAKEHNGWNPKDRLHDISDPAGFVQILFVIGSGACIFNSFAVLLLIRRNKQQPSIPPPLSS